MPCDALAASAQGDERARWDCGGVSLVRLIAADV
jgi:hypothetical protein